MDWTKQNILVFGAGISGRAVAKVLQTLGAQVTLADGKKVEKLTDELLSIKEQGIQLELGRQDINLLKEKTGVITSPGISIDHPLLQEAKNQGLLVMSEVEVAYRICKAPILAVTGTNGKTTTTTLLGEMCKMQGIPTVVGGNIGTALSEEVRHLDQQGIVVAEISSFQLEGCSQFKPKVAAILNITPDHLDRHKTMANYTAMKSRIFACQTSEDEAVLNADDPLVAALAPQVPGKVFWFSRLKQLERGMYLDGVNIVLRDGAKFEKVCTLEDIHLPGLHNVENVLAAAAIAYLAGIPLATILQVIRNFKGVEHRIEPVATINGVAYYNDSKATNPESSIKALESFSGHVILIAGGRDKNTDLTEFMKLVKEKVNQLILLGEAAERFKAAAEQQGVQTIETVNSLAEAVALAHKIAQKEHIVLLSPACASYDMFRSYEERGKVFKELVLSYC